jgi:hypothetical protein
MFVDEIKRICEYTKAFDKQRTIQNINKIISKCQYNRNKNILIKAKNF